MAVALSAMCGDSDYFEVKFKPLKLGPVKAEDKEDAHGRCGTFENHCELLVQIYGNPKCKKGKFGEGTVSFPLVFYVGFFTAVFFRWDLCMGAEKCGQECTRNLSWLQLA